MIRVLLVEDSAVTREYLAHLLSQDEELEVVGVARDGLEAVEQAERLKPDVILMDVYMPRMTGYQATRQIMERFPTPIVMVSASYERDEMDMSFEALRAGALTLVEKPTGPGDPRQAETARCLRETIRLMSEIKVVRRWPRTDAPPALSSPPPVKPRGKIRLVAIGASTGGPQAIAEILGALPAHLAAPILVVQHIGSGFTGGLVGWLGQVTPLTVKLADPDETAQHGTVYVAPDDRQMGVTRHGRIRLAREPADEDSFCPSVSYLFQSVAEVYGPSAMGVLLTGMGRDGASGLERLRQAGGLTIAQDEDTSVVFGMPAEAIRRGAAELVLSPRRIAEAIASVVGGG